MTHELSLKLSRMLAAGAIGLLFVLALAFSLRFVSRPQPVIAQTGGTIEVDTFADEYDDVTPNGTCSLREAIQTANQRGDFGGCIYPGDAVTIVLSTGTYSLTRGPESYDNISGSLHVNVSVTVQGAGSQETIINQTISDTRGLYLDTDFYDAGGAVKLQGLTVQGGRTTDSGGGIYVYMEDNQAPNGASELVFDDVVIRDNQSGNDGGGIYIYIANRTIMRDVTLENNRAAGNGGGMAVPEGSYIYMEQVTVYSNTAEYGGGIYYDAQYAYQGAQLVMTNTTVYSNSAQIVGGGVHIGYQYGYNNNVIIGSSTIAANSAITGGNIYNNQSVISMTHTIVAGPGGAYNPDNCAGNPDVGIDSLGYNLDSGTSCGFVAMGDLGETPADLALMLGDHGGKTMTLALLQGSSAIDAGDPGGCVGSDQRGMPRPIDGDLNGIALCDIGAFEFDPLHVYLPTVLRDY